MRITLRKGRNRDSQLVELLGRGGVRTVRIGVLRQNTAQFIEGAGALRPLLLLPIRGWSFPGGVGDGADQTVAVVFSLIALRFAQDRIVYLSHKLVEHHARSLFVNS